MDEDLRWASATRLRRLLDAGDVGHDEVRAASAGAIEREDPALGAVVAPLLDRPSHGVPMLLKDAGQELAGTPHWVGVAALRDVGARSPATTALASRFEDLGFAIVGKSACPQLSTGITTEPSGFAPTRNPWDRSWSTGGSSGGSAAAVAAGLVPIAHGSDATGSLRCPAALCGVVTLVPTAGLVAGVPPAGQPPSSAWRDFVLARHTEDLELVLAGLTGHRAAPPAARLRVGLLDHDPELGLPVDDACARAARHAGDLLAERGHDVEAAWPDVLGSFWRPISADLTTVAEATRPAMVDWVARRLGRPVRDGELDAAVLDAAARARRREPAEVAAAAARVDARAALIDPWFATFDVLVTPATFRHGWPLGGTPGVAEIGTLAAPFSLSGHPAAVAPVLVHDGRPAGAQLVAGRGRDGLLLHLLHELEVATGWSQRRPPSSSG